MSEPAGLDDLNGLLIGVCARNLLLLLLFFEVQHLLLAMFVSRGKGVGEVAEMHADCDCW